MTCGSVIAQRRHKIAPPQTKHSNERGDVEVMTNGMISPDCAPAAVRDGNKGTRGVSVETHLNFCLFVCRETGSPPVEDQARRRFPQRDCSRFNSLHPGIALERLKYAAALTGLHVDASRTRARNSIFETAAPPAINFLCKDPKGDVWRHSNSDRHACLVTGDRLIVVYHLLRFLPARSACALNASN